MLHVTLNLARRKAWQIDIVQDSLKALQIKLVFSLVHSVVSSVHQLNLVPPSSPPSVCALSSATSPS